MKVITSDRINNYNDLQNLLNVTAARLMLAIFFSVLGLTILGFSLMLSVIDEKIAICIFPIFIVVTLWFTYHYYKQAKV